MIVDGKTICVVGVGPGLGGEIASIAHRDGANVALVARNAERLSTFAAALDPSGDRVLCVPTDIGDESAVEAMVAAVTDRFGGIDALVIVAAHDNQMGGIDKIPAQLWRDVLEMNVVNTIGVIGAVAGAMADSGGSIVLIGSQNARLPLVRQTAYAASKGAMMSAMYHLAEELGPNRIRVNTVMPTWMWGPPVQGYVDYMSAERGVEKSEIIGEITANMPLGEIPADEDVAEAVIFFCSDRARMITGQTLYVNAGEHMP